MWPEDISLQIHELPPQIILITVATENGSYMTFRIRLTSYATGIYVFYSVI